MRVSQNYFSKAASAQGSVYITNDSMGNQFSNNTVKFNSVYGINVNSTGNNFTQNYISSTPTSFYCTNSNGFLQSNKGSLNTCYNSTGCGFVQCIGNNIPLQISSFGLSQGEV